MQKKIRIITVGKIKETYLQTAVSQYKKRLAPYCDLEIVALKDEGLHKEAKKILQMIDVDSFVLDEKGDEMDSLQFSQIIQTKNKISFFIGGPDGILPDIKKKAKTISLSKMTFTHEMCSVFLLEQIYRSFMILNNRKYHR